MIRFALANGFLSTSRTKKVEKSRKVPGIRSITNCNFIDAKHARLISLQVSCYQLDYIFIVLFDADTMVNVHQLPKKNMKQVGLMRCDASVRASSSSASLTFMSLSFRMNYFGIHSRITLCGKSVAIHPQNHSEMMTTTFSRSAMTLPWHWRQGLSHCWKTLLLSKAWARVLYFTARLIYTSSMITKVQSSF